MSHAAIAERSVSRHLVPIAAVGATLFAFYEFTQAYRWSQAAPDRPVTFFWLVCGAAIFGAVVTRNAAVPAAYYLSPPAHEQSAVLSRVQ